MASNGNGSKPQLRVEPEPEQKLYKTRMRRFILRRDEDVTGNSGTGIVAEGVEFSGGHCAMSWLTPFRTTTVFDNTKTLDHLHEHEGRTTIIWLDDEDGVPLAVDLDGFPMREPEGVQPLRSTERAEMMK